MTPDDVSTIVARELTAFRYEPPLPGSGLLGVPWSSERVAAGVEALRAALVSPRRVALTIAGCGEPTDVREAWIVAVADGLLVFYDPMPGEFGLAEADGSAAATDICVRGDLVGTFLAA